jgi:Domain of unknown function (DUF4440)
MKEMDPLEAQRMRFAAMVDEDLEALGRALCDDLHYAHSNGSVQTKTDLLDSVRTRTIRWIGVDRFQSRSRIVGEVATITGRIEVTFMFNDDELRLTNRFLEVARLEDGQWRLMAWQTSRIAE